MAECIQAQINKQKEEHTKQALEEQKIRKFTIQQNLSLVGPSNTPSLRKLHVFKKFFYMGSCKLVSAIGNSYDDEYLVQMQKASLFPITVSAHQPPLF